MSGGLISVSLKDPDLKATYAELIGQPRAPLTKTWGKEAAQPIKRWKQL